MANVVAILWPIFQTACFSSPSIPWLMTWFVYCFPLFAFIPISQHFFYATLILHSGFSKDHVIMKNISICLCWKKKSFDPVSFRFWSADMFFQHCVEQTINIFWGQKKVKHSNKIGTQLKYTNLSIFWLDTYMKNTLLKDPFLKKRLHEEYRFN